MVGPRTAARRSVLSGARQVLAVSRSLQLYFFAMPDEAVPLLAGWAQGLSVSVQTEEFFPTVDRDWPDLAAAVAHDTDRVRRVWLLPDPPVGGASSREGSRVNSMNLLKSVRGPVPAFPESGNQLAQCIVQGVAEDEQVFKRWSTVRRRAQKQLHGGVRIKSRDGVESDQPQIRTSRPPSSGLQTRAARTTPLSGSWRRR